MFKYILLLVTFLSTALFSDLGSLGTLDNIKSWSAQKTRKNIPKKPQTKTVKELEKNALKKAKLWLDSLEVDLDQIAAKGYGDKKRLSEVLAAYLMIHRYSTAQEKKKIEERIKTFYSYTFKPQYLNLLTQNDKQFRKNSMSYLRIMYLLKEMHFDVAHLLKRFETLKPRLDAHFTARGPWQKSMFARYYDMFGFKKPPAIAHTEHLTGLIGQELALEHYKRSHAYMLTHQVFVAFDYGAKRVQTRFNADELEYLHAKLPMVTRHYLAKKNWDLLAELLSCMIYLDNTQNRYFKRAYKALLLAQNEDGTWGDYERVRKKYGKMTDIKYYLHTTGVVIGTLLEKSQGKWDKKKN